MVRFPELPGGSLDGDGVALRFAAERDIPEVLIAHQDDGGLAQRLGLLRPPSGAELGQRVEGAARHRADGTAAWLTIVRPADDECVGQIDVHDVDADDRRALLDLWIAPRDRRRGLGAAALRLAAGWLLGDAGLERVGLLVELDNAAMLATAGAAGATREGVLRGYRLDRRGRVDLESLSLVRR